MNQRLSIGVGECESAAFHHSLVTKVENKSIEWKKMSGRSERRGDISKDSRFKSNSSLKIRSITSSVAFLSSSSRFYLSTWMRRCRRAHAVGRRWMENFNAVVRRVRTARNEMFALNVRSNVRSTGVGDRRGDFERRQRLRGDATRTRSGALLLAQRPIDRRCSELRRFGHVAHRRRSFIIAARAILR